MAHPDTVRFIEQNPIAADTLTIGQMEEYAEHHSGGLVVLGTPSLVGDNYVKMHDSWGPGFPDEPGDVVVHEYDPNGEGDDLVWYFSTGREAFAHFLRLTGNEEG